jgi:hypothetical protein
MALIGVLRFFTKLLLVLSSWCSLDFMLVFLEKVGVMHFLFS